MNVDLTNMPDNRNVFKSLPEFRFKSGITKPNCDMMTNPKYNTEIISTGVDQGTFDADNRVTFCWHVLPIRRWLIF
jgi:hypothetical protein